MNQLQNSQQMVSSAEQMDLSNLNLSQLSSALDSPLNSSIIIHQTQQDLYEVTTSSESNGNRTVITHIQPSVISESFNANITSDLIQEMKDINEENSDGNMHDSNSMVHFNAGMKSTESEFSDTEDMLEGGIVDKVQNTVDNYIEHNSNDVKNIINLNDSLHHVHSDSEQHMNAIETMTEDEVCNKVWANLTDNAQYATVNVSLNKTQETDSTHQFDLGHHSLQRHPNTVIERIPATSTTQEMTVIYEIDINDKDFNEQYTVVDNNEDASKLYKKRAICITIKIIKFQVFYDNIF